MGLSRKQRNAIAFKQLQKNVMENNAKRKQTEIEMRSFVDPLDKHGRTKFQIELDNRAKTKKFTSKFDKISNRAIQLDENGDFMINGKFVPSTQICESDFGRAKTHKMVDESGLNVKPFKPQTHSERTKNSHLNSAYRVRGDVKISGGHVSNEMTIASKHDAVEIELGIL